MHNNNISSQNAYFFFFLIGLALIAAYLPITFEHLATIPENPSHFLFFTLPAIQLIVGAVLLSKQATIAHYLLGTAAITASITTSFFYDAPSFTAAFLLCLVILSWSYHRPSVVILYSTMLSVIVLLVAGYSLPVVTDGVMQMSSPHHASNSLLYSCSLVLCGAVSWLHRRHIEELSAKLNRTELKLARHAGNNPVHDDVVSLYQFAELGRTASLVLHDLSNQLTVLFLDLEGEVSERAIKIRHVLQQLRASIAEAQHGIRPINTTARCLYLTIARQVARARQAAYQNGVTLTYTTAKDEDQPLLCRKHDIYGRVAYTLISNAVQACATSQGKKKVDIQAYSDGHFFFVSVQDTGVGISPENRERIFRAAKTTKADGNGLGLYTSHIAVKHLGGSLDLDPTTKHTRFVLKVPIGDELATHQIAPATGRDSVATDEALGQYAHAQEGVA